MSKIITESAALSTLIAAIGKASAKLDKDIQAALVGVTFQAIKHGNTKPVNELFTILGKGVRRTAVAGWLSTYAPLTLTEGDAKTESPFTLDKDRRAELLEQIDGHLTTALGDNWVDFKPEADPLAVFDVRKQIEGLLKKVAAANKKGTTVEGGELVEALTALIGGEDVGTVTREPFPTEEVAPL
jgi:hypothetical protein